MPNKRRTKRLDVLRLLALIFCLLFIIYAWLFIFLPKAIPKFTRLMTPNNKINILLLGLDYSYSDRHQVVDSSRSDTIMLAQIDPVEGKINLISIPRDTLVEIPGYGNDKINAAFAYGHQDLTKKTVSQLLGIHIDKYVLINPAGIVSLVDSLGGLKMYVEKDMYYNDNWGRLNINLKKGPQKLNGRQVQGYIRFRHDALGDISRVERQQEFLKALFKKIASPAALVRLPWIMGALREVIVTDIRVKDLLVIANFARMINPE